MPRLSISKQRRICDRANFSPVKAGFSSYQPVRLKIETQIFCPARRIYRSGGGRGFFVKIVKISIRDIYNKSFSMVATPRPNHAYLGGNLFYAVIRNIR